MVFHHARGQTLGFLAFVDLLRDAGHTVLAPDLYDGRTFGTVDEGVAHAESLGFDEVIRRGVAAAEGTPTDVFYAGFSLGALPAQKLAQTRPGARGALLFHGGVPASTFGGVWPREVPLEIHAMESDPWFDLDDARPLVEEARDGHLFLYPGSGHLFADVSSEDYDEGCAETLLERTLDFLHRLGG